MLPAIGLSGGNDPDNGFRRPVAAADEEKSKRGAEAQQDEPVL